MGRTEWQEDELAWGLWRTPESDLKLLTGVRPGAALIELGCGSSGLLSWLARLGFNPVGVDFSPLQIERARHLQEEWGIQFPLVLSNAESVPYDRASFDVAISDYGASVWCDPARWLPEARRLLRTNGQLIFITPAPLLLACTPTDGSEAGDELQRDYFGPRWVDFGPDSGVEFHLTYGEWARYLRETGFAIERLIETRPAPHTRPRHRLVSNEWARRWPSEVIWTARAIAR
jgi:SAM-dependent methyltransferase